MRLKRLLSVALQLGAAAAALWIGFVAALLLATLPRIAATPIQKGLIAVVAVTFAWSAACWAFRLRVRHLAWLRDGVWPEDDDPQSQRWKRRATISWGCGLISLATLALTFLV